MLFYNWILLLDISFHVIEDFFIAVIINVLCVWRTLLSPIIWQYI